MAAATLPRRPSKSQHSTGPWVQVELVGAAVPKPKHEAPHTVQPLRLLNAAYFDSPDAVNDADDEHVDVEEWDTVLTPTLSRSGSGAATPMEEEPTTPLAFGECKCPDKDVADHECPVGEKQVYLWTLSGLLQKTTTTARDLVATLNEIFEPAGTKTPPVEQPQTPAVILEPARPGAHVRFLVKPKPSPLPSPVLAAFDGIFGTAQVEFDEEYELAEEFEFEL